MALTLQELKDAAIQLSASDRAALAEFLLRSLEPEEEGWAEAWGEELDRRMAEIRSGSVVGIPAEEVLARLSVPLPADQRAELARRDAEMDANPERALSWEQIRASVETKQ
jgi:putative addiction module component (TIGR02574 family)